MVKRKRNIQADYKRSNEELKLYPQMANANTLPIEESRLVDKILEKQKDD